MDSYTIFAILKKHERLKTEKIYLLRLFVQNAAQSIRNAELNEKLLQKEKLSAVGQVIGMVMHDLRTPVKNIKVITGMIRNDGNSSDLIDLIDQSAEQASEIFDDFLDFINKTAIKKTPVALHKIVREAIKLAEAREGITSVTINTAIPEDMIIYGDESKLRRAISNLIINAVDVLYYHKISAAAVNISAEAKGDVVLIHTIDNGPGIPSEIINTLFEPFVTKFKNTGTGLGLAIVKQYINAHGGNITVKNNNGAIFTITLPN
jgi:two-component system NtrC family sensor kinase